MDLVPLAQAAQDRDRVLDGRFVDQDRLEAPLEGRVLLDVLAVLVERRRADRVELAAGEHRLEQVRGVHRALGRAGADDRVQLVDEQDDLAVGVLDLLEDGLQALLELAAELRPGDQRAEVERDDALVLERLGHVAADDPLGEALGDGGLADARLADQDRVVLRPAAEDLDDAPDLVVPADDRVELARPGLGREVAAVLLQGLRRFPRDSGDVTRWPPRTLWSALRIASRVAPWRSSSWRRVAADLGDGQEEVLGRDVFVAESLRFLLGQLHRPLGARIERQRAALDLRAPAEDPRELLAERLEIDPDSPERLGGHAVVGLDEGGEEVFGVEDGALQLLGEALGGDDGLLGLFGIAVEFHRDLRGSVGGSGVWLVDQFEEGSGRLLGFGVQAGRQHDPDLHQAGCPRPRRGDGACPGRSA